MNKKFTRLTAALALLLFIAPPMVGWGQTRETVTDLMEQTWTGVTGTSYVQVEGLEGSASDAVYTVQCAGDKSSIQLRSKNSNSGIVSTTSGGTLTKVTVTWNSETQSGNKLDIYGKATAYSAPTDLYNSNTQGTLLGSIVKGTSTELTINGNYTFIGMRSNSGAIYLTEIDVEWETGGTSGPTTYTVTYDANGGTGTMVDENSPYEEGDVVTLLDNEFEAPEGKIWDSWEVKDADENDITVTDGTFTMPANNVTVKALWIDDPAAPQINWVLTDLADLTANDVFVIVGTVSNTSYSMSNNSTGNPVASAVTIENGKITSTVADNLKWNVSGNATDGYTFYPNGSTTTWLYCNTTASSGSNTNLRVGGGNNATRKLFIPDGTTLKTKDSNTARYWNVYSSSPDWRGYVSNSTSTTVTFYKRQIVTTDPVINAINVDIAYNATEGSISFTIDNPVSTATVVASVPEGSWLTPGTVGENSVPFTCTANSEHSERSTTVTLSYVNGEETLATKDVTVTQAAAPVIYTTIPALFAAANSTETAVLVTFNDWVVSGVSYNGKSVFVTDNNGNGFVIFDNNGGLGSTYTVGNILSGNAVNCFLKKFNGYAQINVDADNLTKTPGGTIAVANVAMADLAGVNTGALVHYENLTCGQSGNNYTLTDGTTTIQLYNAIYTFAAPTPGKQYNITGVYQQYNNTKEILPRSAADIEEVVVTVPSITVNPATINAPAAGAEGILTVTYENITTVVAEVYFCDANGDAATYDWITANIINTTNNVSYLVEPNDGEARTAYFKVYALDDNSEDVYSNLVTVTQAEYVAPTYAELPFEFDGGRADIEETDGLTQENIGTDYNNSPKLKFEKGNKDNDGLYSTLILSFSERPGTLTYTIKGNGFSGGTFKVQTSVDGSTYADLKTYTSFGTNGNDKYEDEELTSLGENVRYIKWIYTEKSSGNVALGDITLTAYEAPQPVITLSSYSISATAEETTATLDITYENLTITAENDFGIQYYDAEGEEIEKPGWISAEVNEKVISKDDPTYEVTYVIGENNGDARTTYFKVYAMDDETNLVYSDLVTVSQAAAPQQYTLTVESFENLELITFVNDVMEMEEAGTISVTAGAQVMLSIVADEGYVIETLMVNGVDHVNDIAGDFTYTFEMPAEDVTISATAVEYVAPAGGDYVRITSLDQLTDGSIVVIAARYDEEHTNGYYAMSNATSGKPTGVLFTSTTSGDNEILPTSIVDNEEDYYWTVNETENGFTLTNAEGFMIGYNSSTNFATGGNNTEWSIELSTSEGAAMVPNYTGFFITNVNNQARHFALNSSHNFGPYHDNNLNTSGYNFTLDFFVQSEAPATETYTLENITGYTGEKDHYYLIASPVTVDPANVEGMTEDDFDLYYFDEAEDDEWRNYEANDGANHFNLVPGKGYLYAKKATTENQTYSFELTGIPYDGDGSVELHRNGEGTFAGWNLIGNPFAENATIGDQDFYIMNEEGSEIVLAGETQQTIAAMQGIFVQATEAGQTVTFTPVESDVIDINPSITAEVSNGRSNVIDRAIVRFGNGSTLPKFQLNPNNTKIYFTEGDQDFAVVRSEGQGEMPVSFKAAQNGTYTISVEAENLDVNYLHLIDNKTGEDVDLLATPSYSFEARTTDYASRFRLVFNANNGSNENGNETFAYYNGSEWMINNMGEATLQVVDVMGRVLSSETVSGNATINLNQMPGVYMLRLVNGDSVKVQKVVVR